MTAEEFICRSLSVHGEKYDYSKVNYINSKTKVCIICPKHGEFWQEPGSHLRGCGCKRCAEEKKWDGRRITKNDFVKRSEQVHDKKYDYSKSEIFGVDKKVCIICPEHGEFWQKPSEHMMGHGCPKCKGLKISEKKQKTTTKTLVEKFKLVHGDKYDYSKVEFNGWKSKVEIYCKKHCQTFLMLPGNHLNGQGCRECMKEKISNGQKKKTFDEFLADANKIHGHKYDYSLAKEDYKNVTEKIRIICHKAGKSGKEHGIFTQRVCDHINGGCGCPKCNESRLEKRVADFLIENEIGFFHQKTFSWLKNKSLLKLDFYIPKYNIAIECHGVQHFMPVERFGGKENYELAVKRDAIKNSLCAAHGIKILYFSDEKRDGMINNEKELLAAILQNE